jgi:hypothetical protein
MKVFAVSAIAAILLAVVASRVLNHFETTAYVAFSTAGARVDHPGENLVGPDWSGLPAVQPAAPES